jgi:hypothetical protein
VVAEGARAALAHGLLPRLAVTGLDEASTNLDPLAGRLAVAH